MVGLLALSLAACDASEAPAEPDAAPAFCNQLLEECGYCGVEGADCCLDPHKRPEDTRPQYYCIDGSHCAYTGIGGLFSCIEPTPPSPPTPPAGR